MSSGIFDPNVELPKICDKVETPAMPETLAIPEAVTPPKVSAMPEAPTLPDVPKPSTELVISETSLVDDIKKLYEEQPELCLAGLMVLMILLAFAYNYYFKSKENSVSDDSEESDEE